MSDDRSQTEQLARPRVWLALVAAFAGGCATGVDVTDAELEEICAEPNTSCGGGVAGASVGSVGGSTGSGVGGSSNASGGTFSATGGTGAGTANGGTSSATGGTGGAVGTTGGTGGTGGTQPLAQGECLPEDDIVVLYRDRTNGTASSNEPSMVLSVQNPGGASFALNTLAIRYWFTADGTSNFTSNIDYATLNGQGNISGSVNVEFGQESGSDYAEISFSSTDSVGAEGVQEVQLRFHSDPYQNMDQTNDFSFLQGAMTATENRNVTPYLNGMQVGGCIPSP